MRVSAEALSPLLCDNCQRHLGELVQREEQERQDFFRRAEAMSAAMTPEQIAEGLREARELDELLGLPLWMLEDGNQEDFSI